MEMIARISDKYQRILAIFLVFKEPNQILYIRSRHSMMFQWHHWGALESRRRLHSSNWIWRDADMRKWSARSFFSVPLSVVENIYLLIPFQLFFIIIYVYIIIHTHNTCRLILRQWRIWERIRNDRLNAIRQQLIYCA